MIGPPTKMLRSKLDDRSSSGIGPSGVPWDKPQEGKAQACTVPLHAIDSKATSTLCWTPLREEESTSCLATKENPF
ncbi:hypothetical protein CSUI_009712 [Cystoisospora suis]|uniref:Uncharacterized protein n=1 Tax=Cystoisospora suis TaxID=483139 RepID=A0A2C6KIZ8_9APIC|nr:hypothetical protein CSUI_009712 [Cystoisospora suis]